MLLLQKKKSDLFFDMFCNCNEKLLTASNIKTTISLITLGELVFTRVLFHGFIRFWHFRQIVTRVKCHEISHPKNLICLKNKEKLKLKRIAKTKKANKRILKTILKTLYFLNTFCPQNIIGVNFSKIDHLRGLARQWGAWQQSVTGYLGLALAFVGAGALREGFNWYFSELFASIGGVFILGGGGEEWVLGYHFRVFRHFPNIS